MASLCHIIRYVLDGLGSARRQTLAPGWKRSPRWEDDEVFRAFWNLYARCAAPVEVMVSRIGMGTLDTGAY